MLIDIFLILVILICFFILIKILVSKFPILSKINTQEISKEKERRLKFKILEERFIKKLKGIKFKKTSQVLTGLSEKIKNKILLLEKKYLGKYIKIIKEIPKELEERIKKISSQGNKFLEEKNLREAEKKFLEVVMFDVRNLNAYKNLAKIYLEQKNFSQAEKVMKVALELNKQAINWWKIFRKKEKMPPELINDLVLSFINLGSVYKELERNEEAYKCFKDALEFDPNNPRLLDFLVENSIILNNGDKAKFYLDKLKEINPENQKISEWEEKIKNMPR